VVRVPISRQSMRRQAGSIGTSFWFTSLEETMIPFPSRGPRLRQAGLTLRQAGLGVSVKD
jgi:hypothetical protein